MGDPVRFETRHRAVLVGAGSGLPRISRLWIIRCAIGIIASGISTRSRGKLFDCSVGNLSWIVNTGRYDFDDFFGDDIHDRIITINEIERAQRKRERLVQPLDLIRSQFVYRKKTIDSHGLIPTPLPPAHIAVCVACLPDLLLTHVKGYGELSQRDAMRSSALA